MLSTTSAVCRLCRREAQKLFLKGTRCETVKCSVDRRGTPPGMHPWKRGRFSQFGQQLREKQKMKRFFGLRETPFRRAFDEADRRRGPTGDNLMKALELRLDNVIYRLGFALSRPHARQLVAHGHVLLNGRRTSAASATLRKGDRVGITKKKKVRDVVQAALDGHRSKPVPSWLSRDGDTLEGEVLEAPGKEEFSLEANVDLIVEFCSK